MVQLAWNIHAPSYIWNGSSFNGMMRNSWGSVDWVVRDGLNWEASGENTSTWQNYYYELVSAPQSNSATFYNNVQFDIGTNNVPVVVLLNANAGLSNWPASGTTGHYITIVGYNNTTGEYAYMDTCGYSTYCNHYGTNFDGGVKKAPRSQVRNAISSYAGSWIW
jgi:hypothetical protein